jgi:uncharacterized protein
MTILSRRQFAAHVTMLSALPGLGSRARAAAPINVLLVTGQNNHDWVRSTPLVEQILAEAKVFDVTVSTTPPAGATAAQWAAWKPNFSGFGTVLSYYNGEMWPDAMKQAFETYIRGGGSAVMLHAANNPFEGWTAFEQMVGLLWRTKTQGWRVYLDDAGKVVRVPPGEDLDAGHGIVHDWSLTTRDADHPIMKGLPPVWMHAQDELYHAQRGPAEQMHILATAYSDPAKKGTGRHEPQLWWILFGKGRVVTLTPGHLWPKQESTEAFRCVGFRTLLNRCCEWAATGAVTLPVPSNFPTATSKSLL